MHNKRFRHVLMTHERHWTRAFVENSFTKVYSDHGTLDVRSDAAHFEGAKLQFSFSQVLEVKRVVTVYNRTKWEYSTYVAGPGLAALFIIWRLFIAFDEVQLAAWASAFTAGPILLFAGYHLLRVESWKTPWVEVRFINANGLESKLYLMVAQPLKSVFNPSRTQELSDALARLISPAHAP